MIQWLNRQFGGLIQLLHEFIWIVLFFLTIFLIILVPIILYGIRD
jgi:hypothetical protein